MNRLIALLALLIATPVSAWEFSATPICTLTDAGSDTLVKVTFDGAVYDLSLDHPDDWEDAPVFAIRFIPNGPVIQTDRHQINGRVLSVRDSGFGNVLLGLQANMTAQVLLGDTVRSVDLRGASAPVEAFKSCEPSAPMS